METESQTRAKLEMANGILTRLHPPPCFIVLDNSPLPTSISVTIGFSDGFCVLL